MSALLFVYRVPVRLGRVGHAKVYCLAADPAGAKAMCAQAAARAFFAVYEPVPGQDDPRAISATRNRHDKGHPGTPTVLSIDLFPTGTGSVTVRP